MLSFLHLPLKLKGLSTGRYLFIHKFNKLVSWLTHRSFSHSGSSLFTYKSPLEADLSVIGVIIQAGPTRQGYLGIDVVLREDVS